MRRTKSKAIYLQSSNLQQQTKVSSKINPTGSRWCITNKGFSWFDSEQNKWYFEHIEGEELTPHEPGEVEWWMLYVTVEAGQRVRAKHTMSAQGIRKHRHYLVSSVTRGTIFVTGENVVSLLPEGTAFTRQAFSELFEIVMERP